MLRFVGIYGINALSFLTNVGAIFVYSALAGPSGYGTYGIYVALMSVFLILEMSLLKTALAITERARAQHDEVESQALARSFLKLALIPILAGSIALIAVGNLIFPPDVLVRMGGTQIALIVVVEHVLAYPANSLSYHLARERRFNAVYGLRLLGTILRHCLAWTVLLITGSIEMAIVAIVLRGLIFGVFSYAWLRLRLPRSEGPAERPPVGAFAMLASFMATALALLAIQEIPSIYIARTFDREVLGSYRFLYDLTAAIWFVATIYPTVLFTYLLPKRGQMDRAETRRRVEPLGNALLVFHLTYYLVVCVVLAGMSSLGVGLFSAQMPFAFAVTAAVSLLGYSRFQIEAIQALGQGRLALIAVASSCIVVAAFFWLFPGSGDTRFIGWGWLLGQFMLTALLSLVLANATQDIPKALRNIAIAVVGFSIMTVAHDTLPLSSVIWLGIVLAVASGLVGLALLLRLYMTFRNLGAETER